MALNNDRITVAMTMLLLSVLNLLAPKSPILMLWLFELLSTSKMFSGFKSP